MPQRRRLVTLWLLLLLASPSRADGQPVDALGDPLPAGAIHRLGTVRMSPAGSQYCVALTADGKRVATVSRGGSVQIWDADTGKLLRSWQQKVETGNWGPGYLAFSPDAQWLAHGPLNDHIRLLNAQCGDVKFKIEPRGGPLVFAPDGKTIACTSHNAGLILVGVAGRKVTKTLADVAFSNCGNFVERKRHVERDSTDVGSRRGKRAGKDRAGQGKTCGQTGHGTKSS